MRKQHICERIDPLGRRLTPMPRQQPRPRNRRTGISMRGDLVSSTIGIAVAGHLAAGCSPSVIENCFGSGCPIGDSGVKSDAGFERDGAVPSDTGVEYHDAGHDGSFDADISTPDSGLDAGFPDAGQMCQPNCDPSTKSCGDPDGCGDVCLIQDCPRPNDACHRILFLEPIARCQCRARCEGAVCGADDGCGRPCHGTCPSSAPVCWPNGTTFSCCRLVDRETVCE